MEFFRISKGKFVPCNQYNAQFVRNVAGEMVGLNVAGAPHASRPLVDTTPKGRIHVFDVNDKAPFSSGETVARPERAAKIDVVRQRREQRVKTGGNVPITKGGNVATTEQEQNTASTIAQFFALIEKAEMQVNSGLFSAANESIVTLRQLANEVPTKQRANLRNALRLLVAFKNEAVKSDREKRKETVRQERTAKSAERAAAIKSRRDGIAMAKANKEANAKTVRPSLAYTAHTGFSVSRQLADARNRERARF
jgi:hypothetical protein